MLFLRYSLFKYEENHRKLGLSTFKDYMRAYHPDFRLKRLKEDCCDTCIEFKTKLNDKTISAADRESILGALNNHGALARTQRKVIFELRTF